MARRGFGNVLRSSSGRWRARYRRGAVWVAAPTTFRLKSEAERWLSDERRKLEAEVSAGSRPKVKSPTFEAYVRRWLNERPLRPSTARSYRANLEKHALPALGGLPLDKITSDVIRAWHGRLAPDAPTSRARTYALVRTILASAVEEDLIPSNPAKVRGATTVRPATEVITATSEQVETLAAAMPERLALTVLLGAWCQLRVGETLALRRRDVDPDAGTVHVVRGVTWQGSTPYFGPPKTAAGVRLVHMPAAMVTAVRAHLEAHVGTGRDALLFPREPGSDIPVHLSTYSTEHFKRAVRATDLPGTFRFHHLRHTGLTLLASAGASVAELQARAGHTTPGIALRYQHARAERDKALAERLPVGTGGPAVRPSPSAAT